MSSVTSTAGVFQDFQINVKLKISALWVVVMFCYVYGDYIQLHVPGVLAQTMELKVVAADTQLELFAVALLMAIPSVMIFFTLALKPRVNRWLNIILAMCYIVLLISVNLEETWAYYLFFTAIEILVSIAIILYAWKWPKTEQSVVSNA
ncbi:MULTISPECIES: DUF6326 family protein [unclassified Pseudoalteromonas]|uniref:DUF6326 family protein n=1 Tax=unclassified Pseudoalteromonas TaxID=194690 RepID=UPI0015FF705E|nr:MULTISPECIES: DUF6326 family protein [unclassified Pseudoalteromonas]MBB1310810.1 hypothetical protein [Pseudoalteromonas sp. SR41-8]MBB1408336.1 hypothetical protein [Pseudoalteromonas sp. SG44-17]